MLVPDYERFVLSLTDAQAAFLWAELARMKSKATFPLKEALMERVLDSANPAALRQAMVHQFYGPDEPIVAVVIRPGRRRR